MEYRAYEKINGEIIKIIEENYLKDFHKEIKMFQVIMAGYNASEHKTFQMFNECGWGISPMFGDDFMSCLFKKEISSKVSIELIIIKNNIKYGFMATGKLSGGCKKGFIIIKVDKTDELFEQIKSLEKLVYFDTRNRFGNKILNYEIVSRNEDGNGYVLRVSYPCSL